MVLGAILSSTIFQATLLAVIFTKTRVAYTFHCQWDDIRFWFQYGYTGPGRIIRAIKRRQDKNQVDLYRKSFHFNGTDAPVTIVAKDGIHFKVSSRQLASTTGAFPPLEDFVPGNSESTIAGDSALQFSTKTDTDQTSTCRGDFQIALEETGDVLEILFAFVTPDRHPDLTDLPFGILNGVAEAAEKYDVFGAINICKIRMREFLPHHPYEVLLYAYKHDYSDLLNDAAPLLINHPLSNMIEHLPGGLVRPWVKFNEECEKGILRTFTSKEYASHNCWNYVNDTKCKDRFEAYLALCLKLFYEKRRGFSAMNSSPTIAFSYEPLVFDCAKDVAAHGIYRAGCHAFDPESVRLAFQRNLAKVVPFNTFVEAAK